MMAETQALTADEIIRLSREYTLFDWSTQAGIDPLPVDHAKGVYFWTTDGRRFLDFNSQLWSVNVGHSDPRVAAAIARQAERLAYVSPFMTHEPRALLGKRLVELLPGDIAKVFFTLGGAEANENAIKIARMVTGRQKILARYRSYHGATSGAITLTGDPRRWPAEPGIPGVARIPDFHLWGKRDAESADDVLKATKDVVMYEGPSTIAAIIVETIVGTNGILIPPDGYMQGLRELCDRHGILLIADEVMAGFGRTGRWFAVDHWGVVPDIITLAKGLTSSYVPLGAVGVRRHIADYFEDHMFSAGLTYNSHPLACAAALAVLDIYESDDLIGNAARLGPVMAAHHADLAARHPSVGAVRNIGLFGLLDLVRSREPYTPLTDYNSSSAVMKAIDAFLRSEGLYTLTRWNSVMTNPPLCITESQLADGFEIIDRALAIADVEVRS